MQEISALAWHSIAELPSTYEENSQVLRICLRKAGTGSDHRRQGSFLRVGLRDQSTLLLGALPHPRQMCGILGCIDWVAMAQHIFPEDWISRPLRRLRWPPCQIAAVWPRHRLTASGVDGSSTAGPVLGYARLHASLCLRAVSTLAGFACEPEPQLCKQRGWASRVVPAQKLPKITRWSIGP